MEPRARESGVTDFTIPDRLSALFAAGTPEYASNAALAERYDEIAYAALPHPLTHPDRIATIATFLGMQAPAVAQCCVLEVGCNDGANLIPMALGLPSARFVGCDLSERALATGRRTIAELGLSNIDLVQEDLATLSPAHGSFDFIVAHGFYSWVRQDVRDALFALAGQRLSANGVMFVSYNALPGCRVRQLAWEVLHAHVDAIAEPRARINEARKLARIVGEAGRVWQESDEAVRAEFRAIAQRSDSAIFHDDLAVPNDPFYFRDVVAHAARFGLKYLAEGDLHSMSAVGVSASARAFLSTLEPLAREQYLDYVRLRRFRQSLFQLRDAPAAPMLHPARLDAMHVTADPSLARAAEAGKIDEVARGLEPPDGAHVRPLLEFLLAQAPAPIAVSALRDRFRTLARPLETILTDAFVSAIVTLHVHPPSLVVEGGAKPMASPLARLQARGGDEVTNLMHIRARLPDAPTRRLLTLVDGTRDRATLAKEMNGPEFGHDRDKARAFVDFALAQFGRMALLVA